MKEWYTFTEIAEARLPGLPSTTRGMRDFAERMGWMAADALRRPAAQRGGGFEYHYSQLPADARQLLAFSQTRISVDDEARESRSKELWTRFEALAAEHKEICKTRLEIVTKLHDLVALGVRKTQAVTDAAGKSGNCERTIYNWLQVIEGLARQDWLAALAPTSTLASNGALRTFADCHPDAWAFLKSDILRNSEPKFSACYRRMMTVATRKKWHPIPSERTLRRRFDAEVSKGVILLKRKGKDKARALHPAQRRSRAHLHAMQAVNMDGHKLDVFVNVPWSKKPVRFYIIGIQDLHSGKIVSWRLAEAETWEAVRLVIGDMVEAFGIPEAIYIDNGKAFASKWITGDTVRRFRFKVKEEDPRGLLLTLGVTVHWTRPYAGQSKPIERAWRDLAEIISKHPFCEGAYTGPNPTAKPENYMTRAIPLEDFRMHVAAQIIEHNAQTGRRAENCKGRSFDETFAASMALPTTEVRVPTAAQASLWLLASEALKTRTGSGEIHYQGNRYWTRELNEWAGKKVIIRFDPDALHEPVKVYDLKNRLICEAKCLDDAGFDNIDDARMHARAVAQHRKAVVAEANAHATLTAKQLGEIYYEGAKPRKPEKTPVIRPTVTRLVTGNLAYAVPVEDAMSHEELEARFSRGLAAMSGDSAIIPFPQGNRPAGSTPGRKIRAEK